MFEPREVDKPFVQRWLRTTLGLVVRSPVRFALLIGLLQWLDTAATRAAAGHVIERAWVDRASLLGLPMLWIVTAAVARGADDARLTWVALKALRSAAVWRGALGAGCALSTLSWLVTLSMHWLHVLLGSHAPAPFRPHQGQLLDSVESGVLLTAVSVGLCCFPLLALTPGLSALHALTLSCRATEVNGRTVLILFMSSMVLVARSLASVLPAYGMTTAAFLVFVGVLNYVAYRDIFERRGENLALQTAAPRRVLSPALGR